MLGYILNLLPNVRPEMTVSAQRMYELALMRLEEAKILSQYLGRPSDTPPMLSILAFELLLKSALILANGSAAKTHKYPELWKQLPSDIRVKIINSGKLAVPDADLSDIQKILNRFQFIFEKVRYQYEFFEGYSKQEEAELAELWKYLGAPTEEAIVVYHTKELACLVTGICTYVKSSLALAE